MLVPFNDLTVRRYPVTHMVLCLQAPLLHSNSSHVPKMYTVFCYMQKQKDIIKCAH